MSDPVNHPSHYTTHPSGIECIAVTRHMNFNLGNAVKYIWRAGLKDQATTAQDLNKAIWYLQDELEKIHNTELANKLVEGNTKDISTFRDNIPL